MKSYRLLVAFLIIFSVSLRGQQLPQETQSILVKYVQSATQTEREKVESDYHLTQTKFIKLFRIYAYSTPSGTDVTNLCEYLKRLSIIDTAEPDLKRELCAADPDFGKQWYLSNTGQKVNGKSGPAGIDIRWASAYARFSPQKVIRLAVIDSGVASFHPDLFDQMYFNRAELRSTINNVDDDNNGLIDDFSGWNFYDNNALAQDQNGHGTLVSSIIGATIQNGIGASGITNSVEIVPYRVFNQFGRGGSPKFNNISDVLFAVAQAVADGAKILNLSLAGSGYSSLEASAYNELGTYGVLAIISSGNGGADGKGDNNDITPTYPASYPSSNIISVAAQDRTGGLSSFSNYGAISVDIAAPGTDIYGATVNRKSVYFQNFNSGAPAWTVGRTYTSDPNWTIAYYNGDGVLQDRPSNYTSTYNTYLYSWAITPYIDLSDSQGSRLEFDASWGLADDYISIDLSLDGVNWLTYGYMYGDDLDSGSYPPIDISDYDGLGAYIRFMLISDYSFSGIGIFMDNLNVSGIDNFDETNPQYQHNDGTSFSAPIISGVAAMVWAHRPDLTASQVKQAILESARPVTLLSGKVATGGMVDANAALIRAESFPKTFQTITFNNSSIFDYIPGGTNSIKLNATSSAGLPITYTLTSGSGSIVIDTLFISSAGTFTIIASNAGNLSYSSASATLTITARNSQTITFSPPSSVQFNASPVILNATSTSGLAVSLTVVSGPASINGTTLSTTGVGNVIIRASQEGNASFTPAPSVDRTISVTKGAQTITFNLASFTVYGSSLPLTATASSGLPVTYAIFSGPGSISGNTLSFSGAGTIVVRSSQPGNSLFDAAQQADRTVTVSKAQQTITFNPPSSVPFGGSATNLSASASSGLPVAFSVVSGPGSLTGSSLAVTGPGSVIVRATQSGDANYNAATTLDRTITVANFPQTITFSPIADRTFNPSANTLTLSASASSGLIPVTYTVTSGPATVSGNTLSITGAGSVSVQAAQAGNSNYASATALLTFTVAKASQTIAFNPLGSVTLGDAPLVLSSSATSGLPVAFTLISGPATLTGSTLTTTGSGSVVVRATQAGDANYNAATPIDRTIMVAAASQTITFAPIADRTFNPSANTLTLSASASSGLSPVTYTVTSGPATVTGNTLTITGAGSVTVQASQAGNANYGAASASRTFNVAKASQTIAFDPPASAAFSSTPLRLSATASSGLPITFSVASGPATLIENSLTLTGAGSVVVSASQPGDANYLAASSVFKGITVTKAPLTIAARNVSRAVGIANPSFSLSYSGLVGADTPATALTKIPVAATKATASSAPGSYPITLTGGVSNNYTLTLVPGTLTVVGFGGTYEALLFDAAALPVGKLTLTIPANALSYTGTLALARETSAVTLASTSKSPGTTVFVGSTDLTNASATWTGTTSGLDALSLALTVSADGTLTGNLNRNGQPFATLAHGARQRVFTTGQTAPGAGANTLVLHPAYNRSDATPSSFPRGSGFATAPIAAATGVMTLTGFTADGSPLTASLKPTLDDTYLLWVNPYGTRADSFLAGALPLEPHPETARFPDRAYIPRETGLLTWKKAALPANTAVAKLDKSYRAGFGPLGVEVSLDPWLPPATKAAGTTPAGTLAQRLGLAASATASGALNIAHGPADLELGARESLLPIAATLNAAGVFSATNAAATAWTVKITPATGAFTGSFTLRDPAPTPAKPSATTDRQVNFSGVLRQAPAGENENGAGFFLVPGFAVPKGAAPTEQPSGEIRFSAP